MFFTLRNGTLIYFLFIPVFLLNSILQAQSYEIKFDSLNAFGWFGGDDNPNEQRNVAAAQSVTINLPINLESFAFYFSAPFDSNLINPSVGYEVRLKLHVRDSTGKVLTENEVIVPDTFSNGWVTWPDINLNLSRPGKYIFSSYLIGGYDSIKVSSSQACDVNGSYTGGELFIKYVSSDSDAAVWVDWSQHPWDAAFWLKGTIITTDINTKTPAAFKYLLEQNYPNPFNPATKIKFTIPVNRSPLYQTGETGGLVTLKVFNLIGNEVAALVNEYKPAGTYEIEFNAENLPSGIYFYKIQTGGFNETRKMLLLK